ncbi:MFS transporter [Adhaeretor mobilis]|uniref:Nucleoside transporter YegT n=1 Tax=Adhaeretor mobilis TaxID=1930276 RepID=A0A517MVQ7_9BACT|nr:MFS transporter [Adhaeretor mobilis]QDS98965.1 Putative nucleoside transporter YegT [Adhaeretor mobilis]
MASSVLEGVEPAGGAAQPNPPGSSWFSLRRKLAVGMFLQHYSLGLWFVTLGSFIAANTGDLGLGIFTAGFAGFAVGAASIGAIASPFLTGLLADRYIPADRLLLVLHLLAASMLTVAVNAASQATFHTALVGFFICYIPTNSLTNALVFHHLPDNTREFPIVRAWGTIGWVLAGVTVGWLWPSFTGHSIERAITPMKLGIAAEILSAVYCLCLPHTPPAKLGQIRRKSTLARRLLSGETLELLSAPTMALSLVVAFLAALPTQFYYGYGNLYFNHLELGHAAAKMTLGQIVEVGCMLLLPLLLVRVGLKAVLLAGVGCWALRYGFLAIVAGSSTETVRVVLMYAAILLHGAAYTFVSITLQVHVNQVSGSRFRATAQGLLVICSSGLGHLTSSVLAGISERTLLTSTVGAVDPERWLQFWLVPAAISASCWILIAVGFTPGKRRQIS